MANIKPVLDHRDETKHQFQPLHIDLSLWNAKPDEYVVENNGGERVDDERQQSNVTKSGPRHDPPKLDGSKSDEKTTVSLRKASKKISPKMIKFSPQFRRPDDEPKGKSVPDDINIFIESSDADENPFGEVVAKGGEVQNERRDEDSNPDVTEDLLEGNSTLFWTVTSELGPPPSYIETVRKELNRFRAATQVVKSANATGQDARNSTGNETLSGNATVDEDKDDSLRPVVNDRIAANGFNSQGSVIDVNISFDVNNFSQGHLQVVNQTDEDSENSTMNLDGHRQEYQKGDVATPEHVTVKETILPRSPYSNYYTTKEVINVTGVSDSNGTGDDNVRITGRPGEDDSVPEGYETLENVHVADLNSEHYVTELLANRSTLELAVGNLSNEVVADGLEHIFNMTTDLPEDEFTNGTEPVADGHLSNEVVADGHLSNEVVADGLKHIFNMTTDLPEDEFTNGTEPVSDGLEHTFNMTTDHLPEDEFTNGIEPVADGHLSNEVVADGLEQTFNMTTDLPEDKFTNGTEPVSDGLEHTFNMTTDHLPEDEFTNGIEPVADGHLSNEVVADGHLSNEVVADGLKHIFNMTTDLPEDEFTNGTEPVSDGLEHTFNMTTDHLPEDEFTNGIEPVADGHLSNEVVADGLEQTFDMTTDLPEDKFTNGTEPVSDGLEHTFNMTTDHLPEDEFTNGIEPVADGHLSNEVVADGLKHIFNMTTDLPEDEFTNGTEPVSDGLEHTFNMTTDHLPEDEFTNGIEPVADGHLSNEVVADGLEQTFNMTTDLPEDKFTNGTEPVSDGLEHTFNMTTDHLPEDEFTIGTEPVADGHLSNEVVADGLEHTFNMTTDLPEDEFTNGTEPVSDGSDKHTRGPIIAPQSTGGIAEKSQYHGESVQPDANNGTEFEESINGTSDWNIVLQNESESAAKTNISRTDNTSGHNEADLKPTDDATVVKSVHGTSVDGSSEPETSEIKISNETMNSTYVSDDDGSNLKPALVNEEYRENYKVSDTVNVSSNNETETIHEKVSEMSNATMLTTVGENEESYGNESFAESPNETEDEATAVDLMLNDGIDRSVANLLESGNATNGTKTDVTEAIHNITSPVEEILEKSRVESNIQQTVGVEKRNSSVVASSGYVRKKPGFVVRNGAIIYLQADEQIDRIIAREDPETLANDAEDKSTTLLKDNETFGINNGSLAKPVEDQNGTDGNSFVDGTKGIAETDLKQTIGEMFHQNDDVILSRNKVSVNNHELFLNISTASGLKSSSFENSSSVQDGNVSVDSVLVTADNKSEIYDGTTAIVEGDEISANYEREGQVQPGNANRTGDLVNNITSKPELPDYSSNSTEVSTEFDHNHTSEGISTTGHSSNDSGYNRNTTSEHVTNPSEESFHGSRHNTSSEGDVNSGNNRTTGELGANAGNLTFPTDNLSTKISSLLSNHSEIATEYNNETDNADKAEDRASVFYSHHGSREGSSAGALNSTYFNATSDDVKTVANIEKNDRLDYVNVTIENAFNNSDASSRSAITKNETFETKTAEQNISYSNYFHRNEVQRFNLSANTPDDESGNVSFAKNKSTSSSFDGETFSDFRNGNDTTENLSFTHNQSTEVYQNSSTETIRENSNVSESTAANSSSSENHFQSNGSVAANHTERVSEIPSGFSKHHNGSYGERSSVYRSKDVKVARSFSNNSSGVRKGDVETNEIIYDEPDPRATESYETVNSTWPIHTGHVGDTSITKDYYDVVNSTWSTTADRDDATTKYTTESSVYLTTPKSFPRTGSSNEEFETLKETNKESRVDDDAADFPVDSINGSIGGNTSDNSNATFSNDDSNASNEIVGTGSDNNVQNRDAISNQSVDEFPSGTDEGINGSAISNNRTESNTSILPNDDAVTSNGTFENFADGPQVADIDANSTNLDNRVSFTGNISNSGDNETSVNGAAPDLSNGTKVSDDGPTEISPNVTVVETSTNSTTTEEIPAKDDNPVVLEDGNIISLIKTLRLNILHDLLIRTGLSDEFSLNNSSVTLFAPTDEAFNSLPHSIIKRYQRSAHLLKNLLLHHFVDGQIPASNFENERRLTSLAVVDDGGHDNGLPRHDDEQDLSVLLRQEVRQAPSNIPLILNLYEKKGATVNGARFILADIWGTNGIVHVINKVLYRQAKTDLMSSLRKCSRFSIFLELMDRVGITLTDGPYTVFAPVNEAWEEDVLNLNATEDKLKEIINSHIVEGSRFSTGLSDGQELDTLQKYWTVKVSVRNGEVKEVQRARVVMSDIPSINGVIHVVDRTLHQSKLCDDFF
ncbi:Uncharacterised protein g4602 [Pycnogonum litorale]